MEELGPTVTEWRVKGLKESLKTSQGNGAPNEASVRETTVARLYAKFLTLVGVLPGSSFIEITGSRLANDGVSMVRKHVEEVQNAGGGALFVDEAYQLTA